MTTQPLMAELSRGSGVFALTAAHSERERHALRSEIETAISDAVCPVRKGLDEIAAAVPLFAFDPLNVQGAT